MQQLFSDLVARAAGQVGTNKALAEMLGVSPQRLNDWKHGHVPCPLHRQAQIAELAGVDAKEWVWSQICRQLGRAAAAVLLALGLGLAAIGAHGVGGGPGWPRRRDMRANV